MKPRRVAIAGSRSFPLTPEIGAEIVDLMRAYPPRTIFLSRGSQGFDQFVVRVCGLIECPVAIYPSLGGSKNWDRDVQMAQHADEVLLFFDPDTLHDMNTGTAHLAEKALDQRKRVVAYSVANGRLVYAGSND